MTPEKLDAIQARMDAASQPPWRLANPRPDGRNMVERHGYDLYGGEVSEMIIVDTNPADAGFIAAARTDVPALLAYTRDLEARIWRVEKLADNAPKMQNMGGWSPGIVLASEIRAALTATEGQ